MGISRLYRDVCPYTETVFLGQSPSSASHLEVRDIVIDGPALVYHVFNRLAATNGTFLSSKLPTYEEISTALIQFLADLEMCGVKIISIYFDGALPVAKHTTRLSRLEKVRQQLEIYRRAHPILPALDNNNSDRDISQLLWATAPVVLQTQLLPPPFMVASAIEALTISSWAENTTVVPGEADTFCGAKASTNNASILSNDSDILLYDFNDSHGMIILNSLQLDHTDPDNNRSVKAQFLCPRQIAEKLNIPDMLGFAIQRSLDSNASQKVVSQRARDAITTAQSSQEEKKFRQEHEAQITDAMKWLHCKKRINLNGLDPRTSELVVALKRNVDLHMYLPILMEDPQRDSSWSYGTDIRNLAYSILVHAEDSSPQYGVGKPDRVIEYARKGVRISETNVLVRQDKLQILQDITTFHQRYRRYFPASTDKKTTIFMKYHLVAAHIVQVQKRAMGKESIIHDFNKIFHHRNNHHSTHNISRTWNDIHLLANIHAVLYSLRILKQILQYALVNQEENQQPDPITVPAEYIDLHSLLSSMPPISDLFLNLDQIQRELHNELDSPLTGTELDDMGKRINPETIPKNMDKKSLVSEKFIESKARKTRKRKSSNRVSRAAGSSHTIKQNELVKIGQVRSNNPYDMLLDLN